jgi:hypothetical protein
VADFAELVPPAAFAVADRAPRTLATAILDTLFEPRRDALAAAALQWATAHDAEFTAAAFEVLYRRLIAS